MNVNSTEINKEVCNNKHKVLPVLLSITKEGRIKAFGSIITEKFLVESLATLPEGCENIRVSFFSDNSKAAKTHVDRVLKLIKSTGVSVM